MKTIYNRPSVAGAVPIDLVIQVYTNKRMLVGVYLDPRQSSTTSKSAESGNYEAYVNVLFWGEGGGGGETKLN